MLISISKLRGSNVLSALQDYDLEALRDEVESLWEQQTGRLWGRRTNHIQVFDPIRSFTRSLFLELWPITSISLVEEAGDFDGVWRTLSSSEYMVVGDHQLRRVAGFWECLVRVTYTGGYTTDTCPADVRRALVTQAEFITQRTSPEKLIIQSQNFEGGSGVLEEAFLHPFFQNLARQRARK